MSKEATGQFGVKIGSREYWSRINRDVMLGSLMEDKTDYRAMLQRLGSRADDAIEEVYEDLSELGSKIRYLSSFDRNALAKQVEGLYDICRMGGVHAHHSSECIQGLNLSVMSPWNSAFRDDRGIEKAIDIIKQSRYSGSEAVSLLNEAARWSITSAAERDPKKRAFLEAVSQISSSRFLKDVVEEYQAQNGFHRYEGNCGHAIGSHSYRNHIELQVFGYVLPGFGGSDYEKMLRDALESVAERLERDLENAARENDYITDETAAKLKAVVDELERCGVSIGFLDSKIEKLAWFVGGDPDQIRRLQEALNAAGVGQRLKEDGVYGEQTRNVLGKLADKVPDFLKDLSKCRTLSLIVELAGAIGVASVEHRKVNDAIKKGGQLLWNTIWNAGAEYYLRPRGYDVAALLLQHSLEWAPSNLHFSESHWVTKKVIGSKGFQRMFFELKKKMQEKPEEYAVDGSATVDFQETGDTDLYYGIGKCEFKYTCTRHDSFVRVRFTVNDTYNFDEIRTIRWDDTQRTVVTQFGIGSLANDFGFFSQRTDVISTYDFLIEFEETIDLS